MNEVARLREDYERELRYLRSAGAAFAAAHPDVAARLSVSGEASPDPHVERLLEGFAFLTARLNRTLDESTSQLAATMLEQLLPHAVRPLPSATIARFEADPAKVDIKAGYPVVRGTALFADSGDGATVHFQTRYPLTLWPMQVAEARLHGERLEELSDHPRKRSVLSLRLACAPGFDPRAAKLGQLRFHVKGGSESAARLCDLLAMHTLEVRWRAPDQGRGSVLPGALPRFAGLAPDAALLPEHEDTHPGLRLLLEYFAFPAKFQFFDLDCAQPGTGTGAETATGTGTETFHELLFVFDARPAAPLELEADAILLGCVPVLNLFARTSEPVRVDGTRSQYKLVADVHRERATEIYSIEEVAGSLPGERAAVLPRYYGYHQGGAGAEPLVSWHARRGAPFKPGLAGSDMRLLLVDPAFDPALPAARTLVAKLLCTSRGLAETLAAGTALQTEDPGAIGTVRMLHAPSRQSLAALDGAARWQLVAQLSLNHQSLVEGPGALARLKSLLSLNNLTRSVVAERQIGALAQLRCERVTRHIGGDPWRGVRRGYAVVLRLAPDAMRGSSIALFGAVLQRFLALYSGINTFVELTIEHDDGRVAGHWNALASAQLPL